MKLPRKTPRHPDGRPDWLAQCTRLCVARCCTYVALPIDAASSPEEYDNWRWFLMHDGVSIYKSGNRWHLCFQTRCANLTERNLCRIYETRPAVCKDYDPACCEFHDPKAAAETELKSPADLERWLAARRRRRNRLARERREERTALRRTTAAKRRRR